MVDMAVDKLSKTRVGKLGDGKHGDGGGLYFFVRGDSKIWTFRYVDPATAKRAEMSFGSYPALSLADARARRSEAREAVKTGHDPKTAQAPPVKSAVAAERYFGRVIHDCFVNRSASLKRGGDAGRWMSPLNTHVIVNLGLLDVFDVTMEHLLAILQPIWHTKPSAAEKIFQRLTLVMRTAAARWPADIDTTIMSRLGTTLDKQAHTVVHIPSMPWGTLPAFYATLGETPVELALRFLILTASRSAPVRFARDEQFNGNVWIVPSENMKNSVPFRIPLSDEALRVIDVARSLAHDGYLFCAYRGKPISDAAMAKYLTREGHTARPHGFRSSFRTWAEETEEHWHLAETALAHTVGSKVERTYRRTDLLELRLPMMQRWADHVTA
jgi:integrase